MNPRPEPPNDPKLIAWLGDGWWRSYPSVEVKEGAVGHGCECDDAMMAVKDSVSIYLEHEHDRGRNLSVTSDMLLEELKPMFGFWTRIKHGMYVPPLEMRRYRAYRAMREWSKSNLREGYLTPMPREVIEFQEAASNEQAMPLGSVCGG